MQAPSNISTNGGCACSLLSCIPVNQFNYMAWPSHTPWWAMLLLLCCIIFKWHSCWTILLVWHGLTETKPIAKERMIDLELHIVVVCDHMLNRRFTWRRKWWRWIKGWYSFCWIRTGLMAYMLQHNVRWCYLEP